MTTERARASILAAELPVIADELEGHGLEFNHKAHMVRAAGKYLTDTLARLSAAPHAPECGVNRCVQTSQSDPDGWLPCNATVPEHESMINGHPFQPGKCTFNCWQNKDWKP